MGAGNAIVDVLIGAFEVDPSGDRRSRARPSGAAGVPRAARVLGRRASSVAHPHVAEPVRIPAERPGSGQIVDGVARMVRRPSDRREEHEGLGQPPANAAVAAQTLEPVPERLPLDRIVEKDRVASRASARGWRFGEATCGRARREGVNEPARRQVRSARKSDAPDGRSIRAGSGSPPSANQAMNCSRVASAVPW